MTSHQPTILSPSACFVVEREPGKGYQVVSTEGSYADEWKGRALTLLDALGQPDPKGPSEHFRWVGPVAPSGEHVGVSVRLMPNGEARYNQAWFQVPEAVPRPTRSIGFLLVVLVVVFAAGAFAERVIFMPNGQTALGPISVNGGLRGKNKADTMEKELPPDVGMTKLKNELASSRDVRTKLKGYLSQEGFAADTSTPVVGEQRSIKLIADLDKTPPREETIRLSNIEVAKLVRLLKTFDEWTNTTKAPPKFEDR